MRGAMEALTRHRQAPFRRGLVHLVQTAEGPPGEETVADVAHEPLHPRLVFGMSDAAGVDQDPVVGGQFGVAAVDLRIVQIGVEHTRREVVDDQEGGRPAQEGEGRHVGLQPGGLVEAGDDVDEHVAAVAEDQGKGPQLVLLARLRVGPQTEVAKVDLGFLAGRRIVAPHRGLGLPGPLGQIMGDVAPETAQRSLADLVRRAGAARPW